MTAAVIAPDVGAARRVPRIDLHSHMLEPTALEAGVSHSVLTGFGARALPPAAPGSAQEMAERAGHDPAEHIRMLDRLGLDAEVVSSMTVMQGSGWAAPELDDQLNRRINDEIARWVSEHPSRMIGSFTLPLQSEVFSRNELQRCCDELSMNVVQLPAAVSGTYLSASAFRWLWEEIDGRGLTAFVHPDGTRDPWFQAYSMWNSVGQPIEEAKFIASLIYEGILDQLPGLRIVVAHGGGYLPHYFGRLDRNVKAHPHSAVNISKRPSEYLTDLYYDTCLYEPAMLEALVARVGPDQIVMGSDFPVGDTDPVGFVQRCPTLTPDDVDRILGGTLASLLGVTAASAGLGISRRPPESTTATTSTRDHAST
ncbi:MAG: amidohydrolase family protein [Solirubrobacteraceae bacterium]